MAINMLNVLYFKLDDGVQLFSNPAYLPRRRLMLGATRSRHTNLSVTGIDDQLTSSDNILDPQEPVRSFTAGLHILNYKQPLPLITMMTIVIVIIIFFIVLLLITSPSPSP